jgi:hypothetical protein
VDKLRIEIIEKALPAGKVYIEYHGTIEPVTIAGFGFDDDGKMTGVYIRFSTGGNSTYKPSEIYESPQEAIDALAYRYEKHLEKQRDNLMPKKNLCELGATNDN